ncbi:hypothetical protein H5410_021435 [Solanum commersonii]|uniref:Uncharacterized protein n=1 Tax=Solanum commersonii TaxID=4109 RepID=A0A9J5ZBZ6_SOLCO|nr:hypothetical protein H5410_021435 [Solanum commersonii]
MQRVKGACKGRSKVLLASHRLPSATTDVSVKSYRSLSTMDMSEGRSKTSRRTAESFGKLDPARRLI